MKYDIGKKSKRIFIIINIISIIIIILRQNDEDNFVSVPKDERTNYYLFLVLTKIQSSTPN